MKVFLFVLGVSICSLNAQKPFFIRPEAGLAGPEGANFSLTFGNTLGAFGASVGNLFGPSTFSGHARVYLGGPAKNAPDYNTWYARLSATFYREKNNDPDGKLTIAAIRLGRDCYFGKHGGISLELGGYFVTSAIKNKGAYDEGFQAHPLGLAFGFMMWRNLVLKSKRTEIHQ